MVNFYFYFNNDLYLKDNSKKNKKTKGEFIFHYFL